MFVLKTLRSRHFHNYLKPLQNPCIHLKRVPLLSLQASRSISNFLASKRRKQSESKKCPGGKNENLRPLDVVFKEAVGLIEKSEKLGNEFEIDDEGEKLKKKLTELEIELRELKGIPKVSRYTKVAEKGKDNVYGETFDESLEVVTGKFEVKHSSSSLDMLMVRKQLETDVDMSKTKKSLYSLFTNTDDNNKGAQKGVSAGRDELMVKEYSSDMEAFLKHLYYEGYFKNANFCGFAFNISSLESTYAREFVKFAAVKFGADKQQVAKWLSGSDLKKIALFGCPSREKNNVFAAKRLRAFFNIPENTVCDRCVLKESCRFVNQGFWSKDSKQLKLGPIMRLLTAYAMEAVPAELVLSNDLKASVSKLMKDLINLSKSSHESTQKIE